MLDPINSSDPISVYGASAKYDFDNPSKWVTEHSVPLLDEHAMTNEDGKVVAHVDKHALEQIAHNNNKRVRETGDPATLILGHTSDDPRSSEKPIKGYAVNYRVKPFRRDPETGQIYYAIHGDFKVRPRHAHVLQDYPRRSVELWWKKKELDPVALLGGTTPERDLGVVIRNARLKHVSILGGTVPSRDLGLTLRFSRTGETVEEYGIDHVLRFKGKGKKKVHKVMKEYKEGELHSGSKKGPKVTNRKQAIAIALSEAGMSNKKKMNRECAPEHYEMGDEDPERYEMEGDMPPEDDGELPPEDDGFEHDGEGDGLPGEHEGAETDPTVARVFQSKEWKQQSAQLAELSEAVDSILELLQGAEGEGAPPPEEEERAMHGVKPVQFNSTGYSGPMSTNTPGYGKKKMSRQAPPIRQQRKTPVGDPSVTKMKKELEDMKLRFARSEAEKVLNELKGEGIIFGDTPDDAAKSEKDTVDFLTYQRFHSQEDFQIEVDVIRKHYRRREKKIDQSLGLARFARNGSMNGIAAVSDSAEDYEPRNPQEACDLADLLTVKKMSRTDAVKLLRTRRYEPENPNLDGGR